MHHKLYFVIIKKTKCETIMHNLKSNFDKMLNLCKQLGKESTNELGNIPPKRGGSPFFGFVSGCIEPNSRSFEHR
ncbi:hypothetical protein EZS27_013366 [termite gut metagenome]|uniref:Uncharacterized protein n=1 Tax=termite gut metagenome TaxID=433724 RepID=A0A5J4RXV1_9ZZZZ